MCDNKQFYPNQMLAAAGAGRLSTKINGKFRVYHCPFCFGWHITKREYNSYFSKLNKSLC